MFTFRLNRIHEIFDSSVRSSRNKFSLSRYFRIGKGWRQEIWYLGLLYTEMNPREDSEDQLVCSGVCLSQNNFLI